jgi:hypothetical protein
LRWRLIDRILDYQTWTYLGALKVGTLEEYYLLKRWGKSARGPGLFLLESAFQTAAWLVEASSDFKLTFLPNEVVNFGAVSGLEPAEGLIWLVKIDSRQDGEIIFLARSWRLYDHAKVADGLLTLKNDFLPPLSQAESKQSPTRSDLRFSGSLISLAQLSSPENRRLLWRELTAPGLAAAL